MIAMKKRRLECQRRNETDVNCAGANLPLLLSTTVEIAGETEAEDLSTNNVDDHSGNENDEISDNPVVQKYGTNNRDACRERVKVQRIRKDCVRI